SRRNHGRNVRSQDEIAFHLRRPVSYTDTFWAHRNGDDPKLPVEVVRHVVGEVLALGTHINDPRPVSHRRLAFPGERIEVTRESSIGIAARGSKREEPLVFGKKKI